MEEVHVGISNLPYMSSVIDYFFTTFSFHESTDTECDVFVVSGEFPA